jgi:hypothetical protein
MIDYERAKRQLKINWEKFVGKVIDRAEWNRRNEFVMKMYMKNFPVR